MLVIFVAIKNMHIKPSQTTIITILNVLEQGFLRVVKTLSSYVILGHINYLIHTRINELLNLFCIIMIGNCYKLKLTMDRSSCKLFLSDIYYIGSMYTLNWLHQSSLYYVYSISLMSMYSGDYSSTE